MPIVADSPSSLTHSCSLLKSRSSPGATSSPLLRFCALVKRQRNDRRFVILTANLDFEPRADLGRLRCDERGRHASVTVRRRDRSATYRADDASVVPNLIPFARRRTSFHHETGDTRVPVDIELLLERLFADELRLLEFERPLQSGLHRRDRLGQLVPVQRHARLETQDVARAEAARFEPLGAMVAQERVPNLRSVQAVDEELESILSRISGTRNNCGDSIHARFRTET